MPQRADEPRWDLDAQQVVHDASLRLQMVRAKHCGELAAQGSVADGEIVLGGIEAMRSGLNRILDSASELLAVTAFPGSIDLFARTHRNNRAVVDRGVRMVSLFHADGLLPAVRDLIVHADDMPYFLAFGPLQVKVVDRSIVVVEGPQVDGDRTLLLMRSTEAVAAGLHYVRTVRSTAVRAARPVSDEPHLGARTRAVAGMLEAGLQDDEIADTLGVSVRTVRSDVARLMELLGTRTRFATGVRYAQDGVQLG